MNYIKVKELSKSYSDIEALKNLSMEIEAGTLFGILGPNGAGKSTLIKILATLIEPDSGEVFINNINLIKNSRKIRELIGYVAQDIALDKILTGRELLDFQSDLYHINKNKKFERIKKLIYQLEMNDWIDRKCGTYSGGMKRRIDLAAGLLHLPQVLILDEPTVGLDIESRNIIWQLLKDLRNDGMTIILSSHYLDEIDKLAEKCVAYFGVSSVNEHDQAKKMSAILNWVGDSEDPLKKAIDLEERFQGYILATHEMIAGARMMTIGFDNLVQSIADTHEHHLYWLRQATKQHKMGSRVASAYLKRRH